MSDPDRMPDYFDPAIAALRRLRGRAGQTGPQLVASVVDACLTLVSEIADEQRESARGRGGEAVPLVGDFGDSERGVADVQIATEQLEQAIEELSGDTRSPLHQTMILRLYEPTNTLAKGASFLADIFQLASDEDDVRNLRLACQEFRMEYALARQESANSAVDRLAGELAKYEKRAIQVSTSADQAVARAEHAAGIESQDGLSKHFKGVKDGERGTGLKLRRWAGGIGVTGPVVGVIAAAGGMAHILALPLSISIAGLGVYLGRLAEGHMTVARWAATLEIQTLGVYGYSRLIREPSAQDRVLEAFAMHAYTGKPGEPSGDESPLSAAAELERVVRLVLEVQKKSA